MDKVKEMEQVLIRIKNATEISRIKSLTELTQIAKRNGMLTRLLHKDNILVKFGDVYKWNEKIPITYRLAETIYHQYEKAYLNPLKNQYNKKYNDAKEKKSDIINTHGQVSGFIRTAKDIIPYEKPQFVYTLLFVITAILSIGAFIISLYATTLQYHK